MEVAAAEWGKRVSPKMVNKVLTTLTATLALAKRYKLTKDNPAKDAERLKSVLSTRITSSLAQTEFTQAGVKRLTPHGLRRTFASLRLANNVAVLRSPPCSITRILM